MTDQKTIAVDYDGTIHDHKHPVEGRKMGPPMKDAIESLSLLKRQGYEIVVFCYWADSPKNIKVIRDWLRYYKCPFNKITNIKPNADFFVDDKAIYHTSWTNTLQEIEKR